MANEETKLTTKHEFKFTCQCGAEFEGSAQYERMSDSYSTTNNISDSITPIMLEHSKYCEYKGVTNLDEINNLIRLEERVS